MIYTVKKTPSQLDMSVFFDWLGSDQLEQTRLQFKTQASILILIQ